MSFLEWFKILKLEHRIRQILRHPVFPHNVSQGGSDRAIGPHNHYILIGLEGLIVGSRLSPPAVLAGIPYNTSIDCPHQVRIIPAIQG